MAIPGFQDIMLPLLETLRDGTPRTNQELSDILSAHFQVSAEERAMLLPSGQQAVFTNRVAWAKAYLKRAGLIESPSRGSSVITERGREVLARNPERINIRFLQQFPGFAGFRTRTTDVTEPPEIHGTDQERTPEELMEFGHARYLLELRAAVLERLKKTSARRFEQLVMDLLQSMGYGGARKDRGPSGRRCRRCRY
jgi:restriction system protein